jgi:serine/threonine protein kinase
MAAPIPPPPSSASVGQLDGAGGGIEGRDPLTEGMPVRFGKYTLIRKLATGGMAELFLAIQRSVAGFEKLLVIKRILPAMNQDRAFIDMLLHEARIAATLSHPNIVQIFDVGQHEGNYYIAMEHVHGEDLRSIVRQMKKKGVTEFPLEHAISIILGMCAGLAYAHEKRDLDGSQLNIVHRDISPQNVVVTFTGDVKIVDFGIAKSDTKLNHDANTRSGKLKGKIPYMSPEQARGEGIDWRTDIFAASVMLFELTTGKRLFKGASEFETLKLICEREYPHPSQIRPGYPQELEHIVMRGLSKDRGARFQSAREMQAMLEEFVRRERIPTSTIALSQFMQSLFEDKLATQKEALLQGKQLADIIALQEGADGAGEGDGNGRPSQSLLSTPAASHTVTGVNVARPARGAGVVLGLLGAALVVSAAGIGGLYYWKTHTASTETGAASATPVATQAPLTRGAVAIVSDPAGAAIWLNGELRTELTPATLTKLPVGAPFDVKLTRDGYEDQTQTVTLTETDSSSALSFVLKKGTLALDVSVRPQVNGVSLILDGKGYSQTNIDGVTSGEQHRLVVGAPGYNAQQFVFTGNVGEKKHFDVSLVKVDPKDKEKEKAAAAATTAAASGGTGKISIGARGGWCNVAIDGASRGPTPVAGITVGAGPHAVTCTPEGGKTMSAVVTVKPDDTARFSFTVPQ